MTIDMPTLAVLITAAVGCFWDLRTRRIPNVLTFGAAAGACGFGLAEGGLPGLGWSLAGLFIAVAVFFPFFALGGMGGGDVKLLGALGAWLGAFEVLHLALYTALAGGAMGLVLAIYRRYLTQAFRNLWRLLTFWGTAGLRRHPELTLQTARGPKLAYALPIAVGALTTLWLR